VEEQMLEKSVQKAEAMEGETMEMEERLVGVRVGKSERIDAGRSSRWAAGWRTWRTRVGV